MRTINTGPYFVPSQARNRAFSDLDNPAWQWTRFRPAPERAATACLQAAEPALTPGKFRDCLIEMPRREIRPKHIHENILCIGRLPEQKIRGTAFPAGPQDQIRIRLAGGIQPVGKLPLVDLLRCKAARLHVGGTTPRRLTDLIGSLCDLTSGSGDKGTPIIYIQNYFDNYAK